MPQRLAMRGVLWFWLKLWIRWRYPAVPSLRPERLQTILAGSSAGDWWIIDARTAAEFDVSCLPGAVPIGEAGQVPLPGPPDPTGGERPILVTCSVGVRSAAMVNQLRQRGFHKAVNLEGGLFEWVNRGHQLVHGGHPTTQVHPFNRLWGLLLEPRR